MSVRVVAAELGEVDLTMVVLARVLRELRAQRRWTRELVCRRLADMTGQQITGQAYRTYEMATREIPVSRLIGLCIAFGVTPLEVWTKVDEYLRPRDGALIVSLRRVATLTREDIDPARAWARTQLQDGKTTAALSTDALTSLAGLCRIDTVELIGALRDASTADPTAHPGTDFTGRRGHRATREDT
jgi:transcriptional regulator with XRE-family HTH domain